MDEVSPIAPGGEVFLSTGMQTYNAELSSYRGQIVSIAGVPEPSGLVLAGIGIGTALVATRRFAAAGLAPRRKADRGFLGWGAHRLPCDHWRSGQAGQVKRLFGIGRR